MYIPIIISPLAIISDINLYYDKFFLAGGIIIIIIINNNMASLNMDQ